MFILFYDAFQLVKFYGLYIHQPTQKYVSVLVANVTNTSMSVYYFPINKSSSMTVYSFTFHIHYDMFRPVITGIIG